MFFCIRTLTIKKTCVVLLFLLIGILLVSCGVDNRLLKAKLFEDGETASVTAEKFTNDTDSGINVKILQDGKEVCCYTLSSAHSGNAAYYLYSLGGRDYLLLYTPTVYQGKADYSYKLFSLTVDGDEVLLKQNGVEFDLTDAEGFDVEKLLAFSDEVNALFAESILIASSLDSELAVGNGEPVCYQESYALLDNGDADLSQCETLEQKLIAFKAYLCEHPHSPEIPG